MDHIAKGSDDVPTVLKLLAIFAPVLVVPVAARAQAAGSQSAEQTIIQLERDRQAAFVRNDVEKLDRETAEDYTTIASSGSISTKAEMMTRLRAGRTRVISNSLDSLKARVYGNTGVLTGILHELTQTGDVRKDERFRFTRVYVIIRGHWAAVAYQSTRIGE